MKPHQVREMVNELRDVAVIYSDTHQLRDRIAHVVHKHLSEDHIPDTTKMMPTGKDSLQVEAMKQALEALSNTDTHPISSAEQYDKETMAMEALQDAIDDAEEQKPICKNDLQVKICKREWHYLTNDDIDTIVLIGLCKLAS